MTNELEKSDWLEWPCSSRLRTQPTIALSLSLIFGCAGQKVDLTARIREILINYPEGTPILKELIQVSRWQEQSRWFAVNTQSNHVICVGHCETLTISS